MRVDLGLRSTLIYCTAAKSVVYFPIIQLHSSRDLNIQ